MKKFRLHILIFIISLTIPMSYLIIRTYKSLEQEEAATLRFFSETIFNDMEEELSSLIIKEELRSVDEYNLPAFPEGTENDDDRDRVGITGPLPSYIIGYFQNNPDGTYQSPISLNSDIRENSIQAEIDRVNTIFNNKKRTAPETFKPHVSIFGSIRDKNLDESISEPLKQKKTIASKYLDISKSSKKKTYLGKKKTRVEEISVDQALNVAQNSKVQSIPKKESRISEEETGRDATQLSFGFSESAPATNRQNDPKKEQITDTQKLQVEIDPLQSIFIDDEKIFIFRRIVLDNNIYRQGFIIQIESFFKHLSDNFFMNHPISKYTRLVISARDADKSVMKIQSGSDVSKPLFEIMRTFPRPFSFITISLESEKIPTSTGRKTINIMIFMIFTITLVGFFTIYKSIESMINMSERRSNFVSSVTHELKTPLTNIRMYIEMLEYGIAKNKERKKEYFRILNSESGRLSRLINNVLEFSKLEKKQRTFNLKTGFLVGVLEKLKDVLNEKMKQEGFQMIIQHKTESQFMYDREAMLQILINLVENSIKFGISSSDKVILITIRDTHNHVRIDVSDKGQGIPVKSLSKIFDDFYRAENSLTRTTGGTGIGLSLVKKYTEGMGGRVMAANNQDAGCTISLFFPVITNMKME